LIKEQPQRVEGHYWLALNLCGLASVTGAKNGLSLLPSIIDLLEISLILDEAYDQAGAHRVLGRIYFRAPDWPLSVGDRQKSLHHLSRAVKIAPQDSTNHLFLAEILYFLGKIKEAAAELEKVLNGTTHALGPQGLEDDRHKARDLRKVYNPKKDVAALPVSSGADLTDQIK
jgi:tetratricopeptide (TPR) repeat protein